MSRLYAIRAENMAARIEAASEPCEGAFATVEELAHVVCGWPLQRLATVWNNLPGVRPLSRFENRAVAVQRIWRALSREQQFGREQQPVRHRRLRKTKAQTVLRLLEQPEGATLKQLMKATQWQAHSVRGFLSAKVAKQLGLPLVSTKRDGERVYRVTETPVVH